MSDSVPEPAQAYLLLRSRVLSITAHEVGISPTSEAPRVWGVIMETGYEAGTATLSCLVDGTTSLYYSTGGGMLGSGEYAPLAEASKSLVYQAESLLDYFTSAEDFPLPDVGQVRFIVQAYAGTISAETSINALAAGEHPLSPLWTQAQNVLAQLRLASQPKRK